MVRHCDETVVKPEHAAYLTNRGNRFYDCYAADRSLARLVSDYRFNRLPRAFVGVDE